MKIAIAGASGFVGTSLVRAAELEGFQVVPLVRRPAKQGRAEISWNPSKNQLDAASLQGVNCVICLSGENIASGRWTSKKKQAILNSRVSTLGLIANTMASMDSPPERLVAASAVGYYGANRGDEVLTEDSPAGDDFLAGVCKAWEWSAQAAVKEGIQVVHTRLGMVLHPSGGALKPMLAVFKLGLGGRLGRGEQFMSWVSREDTVQAILHLAQSSLTGPINVCAPEPVTNKEFTRELAKALKRPAVLPVPETALKLILGEMAESLLLGGARATPTRLQGDEFEFRHPDLPAALRSMFG